MIKINCKKITFLFALIAIQVSIAFAQTAIKLDVDATDAGKNIIRVRETMSVSKSGEFALLLSEMDSGRTRADRNAQRYGQSVYHGERQTGQLAAR